MVDNYVDDLNYRQSRTCLLLVGDTPTLPIDGFVPQGYRCASAARENDLQRNRWVGKYVMFSGKWDRYAASRMVFIQREL